MKMSATQCFICKSSENCEVDYGKIVKKYGLSIHYYCLLLTSNLVQSGEDHEGFYGFMPNDIKVEVRRIKSQRCYICKQEYANISCCSKKCHRNFHLVCGVGKQCLSNFVGTFQSFCASHVRISDKVTHEASELCAICYDEMGTYNKVKSIRSPCCRNGWFHKSCLSKFAISAGYFFKCPLCNNKEDFQAKVVLRGIFIPEQDAAWELEPNAFNELLVRPSTCDAIECVCPDGREYDDDGDWDLMICETCGSTCSHRKCCNETSKNYRCEFCKPITADYVNISHSSDSGNWELEQATAVERTVIIERPGTRTNRAERKHSSSSSSSSDTVTSSLSTASSSRRDSNDSGTVDEGFIARKKKCKVNRIEPDTDTLSLSSVMSDDSFELPRNRRRHSMYSSQSDSDTSREPKPDRRRSLRRHCIDVPHASKTSKTVQYASSDAESTSSHTFESDRRILRSRAVVLKKNRINDTDEEGPVVPRKAESVSENSSSVESLILPKIEKIISSRRLPAESDSECSISVAPIKKLENKILPPINETLNETDEEGTNVVQKTRAASEDNFTSVPKTKRRLPAESESETPSSETPVKRQKISCENEARTSSAEIVKDAEMKRQYTKDWIESGNLEKSEPPKRKLRARAKSVYVQQTFNEVPAKTTKKSAVGLLRAPPINECNSKTLTTASTNAGNTKTELSSDASAVSSSTSCANIEKGLQSMLKTNENMIKKVPVVVVEKLSLGLDSCVSSSSGKWIEKKADLNLSNEENVAPLDGKSEVQRYQRTMIDFFKSPDHKPNNISPQKSILKNSAKSHKRKVFVVEQGQKNLFQYFNKM